MSGDSTVSPVTNGPAPGARSGAGAEAPTETARRTYVIDTSVAVKWYIPESFSIEAKRYLGKGIDRHAPDYLPVEAASVVLKRVRTQDVKLRLSPTEAQMVLAALKTTPIQFHESRPLIDHAFVLAVEIGASLYDALFLALALRLDGELVTADDKLFRKIQASPYAAHGRWVEIAP